MNDSYPFVTGDRVCSRGENPNELVGEVRAVFRKRDGSARLVVEFDIPAGAVGVMRPDQVMLLESPVPQLDTLYVQDCAPHWESAHPDWSGA